MTLVDAFPGNNEISLAEFRIEYLSSAVDYTIIAESNLTHSGHRKELYFNQWLMMNEALQGRVIVLNLDLSNFKDSWEREIATRELLLEYVLETFPSSHFILSDLDEIPSRKQIEIACSTRKTFHFLTPTVYLNANWHLRDSHLNWSRGVIGHTSRHPGENGGRFKKLPILNDSPGIHLSWIVNSEETFLNKINSTAHTELSKIDFSTINLFDFASRFGIDPLGRFNEKGFGILKIKKLGELSSIQNSLFLSNSEMFQFELKERGTFKRTLASLICTLLWKNEDSQLICSRIINREVLSIGDKFSLVIPLTRQLFEGLMHLIFRCYRKITAHFAPLRHIP